MPADTRASPFGKTFRPRPRQAETAALCYHAPKAIQANLHACSACASRPATIPLFSAAPNAQLTESETRGSLIGKRYSASDGSSSQSGCRIEPDDRMIASPLEPPHRDAEDDRDPVKPRRRAIDLPTARHPHTELTERAPASANRPNTAAPKSDETASSGENLPWGGVSAAAKDLRRRRSTQMDGRPMALTAPRNTFWRLKTCLSAWESRNSHRGDSKPQPAVYKTAAGSR